MSKANKRQVDGDHYKIEIQPWDFIHRNGIGFLAGNAIKYLTRYKSKNGVRDLEKAIHYIEKLIEEENASSTIQRNKRSSRSNKKTARTKSAS